MLKFKKAILVALPPLLTLLGLGYAFFKQRQPAKPVPPSNPTEQLEYWQEEEPFDDLKLPSGTEQAARPSQELAEAAPESETTAEFDAAEQHESLSLAQAEARLPELAAALSDLPLWQKWLAQTRPLQRLVAAMDAVALGERPLPALDFMLPQKPFAAEKLGGHWRQSQLSRQRFAAAVQLFCALHPGSCAKLYLRLEPALQEACRALGYQDKKVREMLTEACSTILSTPILDEEAALLEGGQKGLYYWQNEEIEALNAAQKLFLRLGHENAAKVRAQVEAVARELELYQQD